MRNFILLLFFLQCLSLSAVSQEIEQPLKKISFYEADICGTYDISDFKGNSINFMGAKASWFVTRDMSVGARWQTMFSSEIRSSYVDPKTHDSPKFSYFYFGVEYQYYYGIADWLSLTGAFFAGAANYEYALDYSNGEKLEKEWYERLGENHNPDYGSKWFPVFEPSFGLEFDFFRNIDFLEWLKFEALVGFKLTADANYKRKFIGKIGDVDMSRFTFSFRIKVNPFEIF